jgi:hypothetical protein
MAGAMVSNKARVAGLGVVGLCTGSTPVAYLTKAQIQLKLLAFAITESSIDPHAETHSAYVGVSYGGV